MTAELPDLPVFTEPALCAEVDPDIFFPEKGGSTLAPMSICGRCAARDECLEFALTHGERFGIWGALSERSRRRLARERGITPPPPPIDHEEMARRRADVAALHAAGYSRRDIADALDLPYHTVADDINGSA